MLFVFMKQIPLTKGLFTLVDDEDYDYLMQWKWYWHFGKSSQTYYVLRNAPKGQELLMHRMIMKVDRAEQIDHIDFNGLNNQKYNLRIATRSQNCMNRRSRRNSTSKYLGVSLHESGKWHASIGKNGKIFYLGRYWKEEDAAKAYDAKAIQLHGEFANLNFKLRENT